MPRDMTCWRFAGVVDSMFQLSSIQAALERVTWLRVVLFIGPFLLIASILYLFVPLSSDQALFDYVAWSVLEGRPLYSETFEINWPGKIILHAAGIVLFGVETWSFRAIDLILTLTISGGMFIFLRRQSFATAPGIAAMLYLALYVSSGMWLAGQRDTIAGGLLFVAAAMALSPAGSHRSRSADLLATGTIAAFAAMIKPTMLPFLAGLLALELIPLRDAPADRRSARRSALILAGFAIPVLLFLAIGNPSGLYEQTILFNLEVYGPHFVMQSPTGTVKALITGWWHWLIALSLLSLAIWIRQRGLTYGVVLVLGIMTTVTVSYVVQSKGLGYHLGGLLAVFAVSVAILIDHLIRYWQARPQSWARLSFLALVVGLTLIGTLKKTTALLPQAMALVRGETDPRQRAARELADIIAAESGTDAYVLQWGRNYITPFLAERQSPWPFINTALRFGAHKFRKWPEWQELAQAGLTERTPEFVLIDRQSIMAAPGEHPTLLAMTFELVQTYEVVRETPWETLYRRK